MPDAVTAQFPPRGGDQLEIEQAGAFNHSPAASGCGDGDSCYCGGRVCRGGKNEMQQVEVKRAASRPAMTNR
jgi:hypothetical protein